LAGGKSTQKPFCAKIHFEAVSKTCSFATKIFYMNWWLVLIPLISAFIGWFTNWIAIKMLFHPKQPKKVLGITFQGIFPKRQQQFAEKLGKLVSNELLSFNDIEQKITSSQNLDKIMPHIEGHIDKFIKHKLNDVFPMLSMFVSEKTLDELKVGFMNELRAIFPDVMKKYMGNLQNDLDLDKIVTKKVQGFSSDKLEAILNDIMSKEFKFVEIIGGVLGFIIGLLQVLLTLATN
jgi:uncharacterized membrane protein YheB (UPF0754 family)